jgi:hypothetical protein
VLRWPDPNAPSPGDLAGLLVVCRDLLSDSGHAVIALVPPPGQTYLDHASRVLPAVDEAGLRYVKHIVAVATPATVGPQPSGGHYLDLLVLVIGGNK